MSETPRIPDFDALQKASIIRTLYYKLRLRKRELTTETLPSDVDRDLQLLAEGAVDAAIAVRAETLETARTVGTVTRDVTPASTALVRLALYLHGHSMGSIFRTAGLRALGAPELEVALDALCLHAGVTLIAAERAALRESFGRGYSDGVRGQNPYTESPPQES